MSEHKSKHSSHAAVGETRLRRVYLDIPDTVVKLPDGGTMTLRRRERSNSMPSFRKFNPRKMQQVKRQAGRQQGRQSPVSGLGAVMDAARNLPLSKLLLAATLAQHAFQALRGLWCRWAVDCCCGMWQWLQWVMGQSSSGAEGCLAGGARSHQGSSGSWGGCVALSSTLSADLLHLPPPPEYLGVQRL